MAKLDRNIVLYSGGLDSFVMANTVNDPTCIFFDIGTEDNKKEKERLPGYVQVIPTPSLAWWELPNKIIPFRNFLFVLMAANYGNKIHIGCTIGDTTRDKDYVYKALCESVLNYMGADHDKMPFEADRFEVVMPFKHMTKTELLGRYLDFHEAETLVNSRSCYTGDDIECGTCRACLRKFVAFHNNGIAHVLQFQNIPNIKDMVLFLEESVLKNRHPKEIADIQRVTSIMEL